MVSIVDGGNAFSTFAETLDGGTRSRSTAPTSRSSSGAAVSNCLRRFATLTEGAVALTVHRRYAGQDGRTWTEPFAVRCERQSRRVLRGRRRGADWRGR